MVDYLSLAISHGVLIVAFWRLLWREELNADPEPEPDTDTVRKGGRANRA